MSLYAESREAPKYFNSNTKSSVKEFGEALFKHIKDYEGDYKDIVVLCIGTDRATGDSLGPLIGHKLNPRFQRGRNLAKRVMLYGTLEKPVHAQNICQTVENIYSSHNNPLIIAIDACLGKTSHIGYVQLGKGSVYPGAGVSKEIAPVGDIYITGIVNFYGSMELLVLQNTRLHVVMKMAGMIASGICVALEKLNEVCYSKGSSNALETPLLIE